MPLLRPDPLTPEQAQEAAPVSRGSNLGAALDHLEQGGSLRVVGHVGVGLAVLDALARRHPDPPRGAPHEQRTRARRRRDALARRVGVPIEQGRLLIGGGKEAGFLGELFADCPRLLLPLPALLDLDRAWLRYRDGVHLPVLGSRVHPFWGTYAPTRTVHLELFATWLSGWQGPCGLSVDVGTGCGVLALILARRGFDRVLATDLNPNAVESVLREVGRRDPPPPIQAVCGDLLAPVEGPADLIVFNPPWTRGEPRSLLDQAMVYPAGLFERFFAQARERLAANGRVVVVFSNLIELVQPDVPHPVKAELDRGRFRLVQRLQRKVPGERGPDGRRRRTREKVEVWELVRA